jgi:hypothetical protein
VQTISEELVQSFQYFQLSLKVTPVPEGIGRRGTPIKQSRQRQTHSTYAQCYNSFQACVCNAGYIKMDGVCVPESRGANNFISPANSARIPNLECYTSFQDCACFAGYGKKNNMCVWCTCSNSFICPVNSYCIPYHQCYDTLENCACVSGYEKKDGKCVNSGPCP